MKPYPRNNISYTTIIPIYSKNETVNPNSRYSTYRIIDNVDFPSLEIKLTNSISKNETYRGYYYTTSKNENLYSIAKKYYDDEELYWVIAKANNIKNDGLYIIKQGVTITIPAFSELTSPGGYFNVV